ncbi:hypothetical protein R1flu_004546 [Riccia fluitans]|uniref:Secreted protein n=1 Tax=Riccia fluitans TaxID=41844 RepID=A0ABD1YUM9_9MARC
MIVIAWIIYCIQFVDFVSLIWRERTGRQSSLWASAPTSELFLAISISGETGVSSNLFVSCSALRSCCQWVFELFLLKLPSTSTCACSKETSFGVVWGLLWNWRHLIFEFLHETSCEERCSWFPTVGLTSRAEGSVLVPHRNARQGASNCL